MSTTNLNLALKRVESLITRDAEVFADPAERKEEFDRRLERTNHLLACLENPGQSLDLLHIAGTSGKGSVAMICEAVLLESGIRTGTHTTPYLQTPLEKVRVDGRLIQSEVAIELVDNVMACVSEVHSAHPELGNLHYAEAWLGMAMRYFSDSGCNVAVIETGLGGRYDSTNVLSPVVTAITSVHYDHVRVLGATLSEIAWHKAGIIKSGIPVVVGEMAPEAIDVIRAKAVKSNAQMVHVGSDVTVQVHEVSLRGSKFTYQGINHIFEDLELGLLGAHQVGNAAIALAMLELYAERTGKPLIERDVRNGLKRVQFAGRIEIVQRTPLVVLDGAHNEEKIDALIAALANVFTYNRLFVVLGMLETKDAESIVRKIAGLANVLLVTAPRIIGKPAIPPTELVRLASQEGGRLILDFDSPTQALERALGLAGPDDMVLVTGSLYLVGELRNFWHNTSEIIALRKMLIS